MRKSQSERRLDCVDPRDVELNLDCRDEIIPILVALRYLYSQKAVYDKVMQLIAEEVNHDSCSDLGRKGMDYWQIVVLAAVRLGCNFDYDRLQDLAENHRKLRHIMGVGDWDDQTSFKWQRIRDNVCLLSPETLSKLSQIIYGEGHQLDPEAVKSCRVDSFVVETNIHYPTESSLMWDGLRKIIQLSALVAVDLELPGWRQHEHLLKKIKHLHQSIGRLAASKKRKSKQKLKKLYQQLINRTKKTLTRAEELINTARPDCLTNIGRINEIRVFMERTRLVASNAYRRVILGEKVPCEEKLFSMFETHTQLYRRGKAGQENQFGRLVMICEDGAGFITHHYLMDRTEQDKDVAVSQTRILQERLGGAIETISFDRGFHSDENERELAELINNVCLPKRGVNQFADQMDKATVKFRAARQRHPGVESAIGALQSGNGLERSRDRTEKGFERYICLGIFGRNLHVLGKMLIAKAQPKSKAAQSQRKHAA